MNQSEITSPILSVIVCTYNRADRLKYCLQSLAEQNFDSSLFEVLIIDNNSTDGTKDIALAYTGRYSHFRLISESSQGLSHARNRGWQEALGTYVAYIDDDAKAAWDWCERIIRTFQSIKPPPDAVGGPIHAWYETPPRLWISPNFGTFTLGDAAGFLDDNRAPYGFFGSNMTIPRALLKQHGGFDPNLGMTGKSLGLGEDTDFCKRIRECGARCWYDPGLIVYHYVPAYSMSLRYQLRRKFISGSCAEELFAPAYNSQPELKVFGELLISIMKSPVTLFKAIAITIIREMVTVILDINWQIGRLAAIRKRRMACPKGKDV